MADTDEVDRLRKAMRTVTIECEVFHHSKEDRHDSLADCPVAERFRAALEEKENAED